VKGQINKEIKKRNNINTAIWKIADVFFFIFDIYSGTFFENNIFKSEQISKQNICECFKQNQTFRFTYEEIEKACLKARNLNLKYWVDIKYSKREIASIIRNKIDFEWVLEEVEYETLEDLINEEYWYLEY
jgi:hypothetical protein